MLRALFAWRWSGRGCPSNTNPCEDITGKNTGIDRLQRSYIFLDAGIMIRRGRGGLEISPMVVVDLIIVINKGRQ